MEIFFLSTGHFMWRIFVIRMSAVNNEKEEVPPETRLVRLNDFLFSSNMDNVNMFKVSSINNMSVKNDHRTENHFVWLCSLQFFNYCNHWNC